ncbi:MAG: T9SS type A sorting domain-containing protein [Bacteroidetes bacterium]|nr:T9SS type A sorting domain-containing protein [Bacteroidota bacterium]
MSMNGLACPTMIFLTVKRYGHFLNDFPDHKQQVFSKISLKNSIDVFPNPSSGLFQIRLINGNTDVQQINILNTNGALVKTITTNGGLNFILSEKLTPGTYFIQLIGEKSVYEGKKIVVF